MTNTSADGRMDDDDKRYDDVNFDVNDVNDFLFFESEKKKKNTINTTLSSRTTTIQTPTEARRTQLTTMWDAFCSRRTDTCAFNASSPPPGPWLRERRHHRRRGQALPERPIRPSESDQRRVRRTAKIHRRVGRPRDGRPRRSARGRHSRKLRRLRGDFERALKLRPTHGIRERVLSDRIQRKGRSVTRDREHGREVDARPRGARRLGLRRRARKGPRETAAAGERREMIYILHVV